MFWTRIIFGAICLAALGFFAFNVFKLFSMLCLGQWDNRFDHLAKRLKHMFIFAFGQVRVVKQRYGINHFIIFWGFMTMILLNVEFMIAGIFPKFSFSFLGDIPYSFFLIATEIMSVVVLVAVIVAAIRRLFFRPKHIDLTFDAFIILFLIAILMVAYFGYHSGEIALEETGWANTMIVSNALAPLLFTGMNVEQVRFVTDLFWWIHALVLLAFLNYLPYSKHLHVLTAIPNCFFRSFDFIKTAPRIPFKKGNSFGISKVIQFTWKDLMDFMACTECGRCQAACPANTTGKHLNPKSMMHRGKDNLFANSPALMAGRPFDSLERAPKDSEMTLTLIGDGAKSMPVADLWACTTCGSCMQECPVFIEHVPKFIEMRRHLVMEQSEFPHELLTFFENSEQRFNPWGIAPSDRAKWTEDLNVPIAQEGTPVEYLYFVGCAGSFDSRAKNIAVSMTKILNAAGASWGILGTEERCCGDSLRRLGNEYVFDKMVRDNIAIFNRFGVKKIVCHCPHCYSTLKNDYAQFGAEFEVIHHSELIGDLIAQGKLTLKNKVNGKTVFHDSCYLGRYNDLYDQPRNVVKAASGNEPLEMERSRERSFCCGGGGGLMWMEETEGKRIFLERTEEAVKQDPSTIAVSCPYCMTMFEDGVKEVQAEGKIKVKDIAEMTAEALG